MDYGQFDEVTKRLSETRISRATALRGVLGGAAALVAARLALDETDAKKKKRKSGKKKGRNGRASQQSVANDQVCLPLGSGKIDTKGDPQTVDLDPSPGYQITSYCVKAGSENQGDGPVYVTVEKPVCDQTVTISYPSGKDISHYSYNEEPCTPPPADQWCSPGYWRQTQHLGSWAATGISPDAKYNDYFDPDLAGNPTLWQVLQAPKTYGGAAFNNVGDLLSAAHPDVNFNEERVEDSCPLGRNEG